MKKNNPSDGILVFDRYYSKKPVPALLAVGRVMFCVLISVSAMLYLINQYELEVSTLNICLYSGISAALFSVLFLFVKRRYAVPALLIAGGGLIWINFGSFWHSFSYFVDEAMLLVEGRFISPRDFVLHDFALLTTHNPDYAEGIMLGCLLLCMLYSLLCAATMARRIRAVPAIAAFALLCVPMLLSERLEIDMWFVPFAVMAAAAVAIEINYRDGLAVLRSDIGSYRMQVRDEERKFLRKTDGAGMLKRTGMQLSYYSKYGTTGCYCALIFSLAFLIGCGIFGEGKSIDYRELYQMFTELGDGSDDLSSDSSASDYFTSPDENERLNIASPGRGEEDMLRVSFTGEENIYLRGDIGVDFVDNSWTSPVNDNYEWSHSSLSERYRPAELLIIQALIDTDKENKKVSGSEISIEYLTQTDVVFLPAYTQDHSYYENDTFDIFGDYVVRVSDSAENYINSVQCSAVMVSPENARGYMMDKWQALMLVPEENRPESSSYNLDYYYEVLFPFAENGSSVISDYRNYVAQRYTKLPENMRSRLREYLTSCGFYDAMSGYAEYSDNQFYRLFAADYLCDYLANNYTYSLSGGNSGDDMLFQFLNETKTGHCSLYASAMTLLLREAGIPARYCTGFSIYPDTVDGNETVLKEKNLHAWVEVYLDEFGWVTFDPTSAAVSRFGSGENTTLPERGETLPAAPENVESREQPTKEAPETVEAPPVSQPQKKLPTGIIVAAAAAIAVIVVAVLMIIGWHRLTERAERAAAGTHSTKDVYGCLIDIAELCGVTHEAGQLPRDFYRACGEHFGVDMESCSDALEAAAFSDGELSESDNSEIHDIFRRLFAAAVKQSGALRKLKIRRLVVEKLR